jgi:uncharacterized membrane protein
MHELYLLCMMFLTEGVIIMTMQVTNNTSSSLCMLTAVISLARVYVEISIFTWSRRIKIKEEGAHDD